MYLTVTGGSLAGTLNNATYTAPGTAGTYTLTATSVADTTAGATLTITISKPTPTNHPPAIARFAVSPNPVEAGTATAFSWSVSDPDGDALTCTLDTNNDGSPEYTVSDCANNTSRAHTYASAGTHTANLTVSDGSGGTDADVVSVHVTNPAPTLSGFHASPDPIAEASTTTFSWTIGNVASSLTCSFDAGDGTASVTIPNCATHHTAPHAYAAPGTYTATLAIQGTALTANTTVTVTSNGLSNVVALTNDGLHSVALKKDGTVWTWGYNENGQLGDGTTTNRSTPVRVEGLSTATAVASGVTHTLALDADGTVWAWGNNRNGQLGNEANTSSPTPVRVRGLRDVIAIASAGSSSLALKSDGTVWGWGLNVYGQLGDGTRTYAIATPVQTVGLSDVIEIATGGSSSFAIEGDGSVWGWGWNSDGELGNGTTASTPTPVRVAAGVSNVVAISAGSDYTLFLAQDGTVWASGMNTVGQLGNGSTTDAISTPVRVSSLSNVAAVSAGADHSLAVTHDGSVWAWGYNSNGQLGDGTTANRSTPLRIGALSSVIDVAAGEMHSLALKQDGGAWAWGYNLYGQLGDGTNTDSSAPVRVHAGP